MKIKFKRFASLFLAFTLALLTTSTAFPTVAFAADTDIVRDYTKPTSFGFPKMNPETEIATSDFGAPQGDWYIIEVSCTEVVDFYRHVYLKIEDANGRTYDINLSKNIGYYCNFIRSAFMDPGTCFARVRLPSMPKKFYFSDRDNKLTLQGNVRFYKEKDPSTVYDMGYIGMVNNAFNATLTYENHSYESSWYAIDVVHGNISGVRNVNFEIRGTYKTKAGVERPFQYGDSVMNNYNKFFKTDYGDGLHFLSNLKETMYVQLPSDLVIKEIKAMVINPSSNIFTYTFKNVKITRLNSIDFSKFATLRAVDTTAGDYVVEWKNFDTNPSKITTENTWHSSNDASWPKLTSNAKTQSAKTSFYEMVIDVSMFQYTQDVSKRNPDGISAQIEYVTKANERKTIKVNLSSTVWDSYKNSKFFFEKASYLAGFKNGLFYQGQRIKYNFSAPDIDYFAGVLLTNNSSAEKSTFAISQIAIYDDGVKDKYQKPAYYYQEPNYKGVSIPQGSGQLHFAAQSPLGTKANETRLEAERTAAIAKEANAAVTAAYEKNDAAAYAVAEKEAEKANADAQNAANAATAAAADYANEPKLPSGALMMQYGVVPKFEYKDMYYFKVKTTNEAGADTGTNGNVYTQVTYVDNQGKTRDATFYWHDLVHVYYDVANTEAGRNSVNYLKGGGETYFAVELPGLVKFKQIRLELLGKNNERKDYNDWQMDSLEIYKLEDIASSKTNFLVPSTPRTASGKLATAIREKTYFYGAQAVHEFLLTMEPGYLPADEADIEDKDFSGIGEMSYAEAMGRFNVTDNKYRYRVDVKVGDMEDAGSGYHFYFQLMFQNGNSTVVLANEQLAGDAFRQRQKDTEAVQTFYIDCNQNYGELVKIKIYCHVPDVYIGNANMFDKAYFEKVSVTQERPATSGKTWVIENIGWSDVMFVDEASGAQFGSRDKSDADNLASENDVAITRVTYKEYPVTSTTNSLMLLFEVQTTRNTWPRYEVYGNLIYTDSKDARKETGYFSLGDKCAEFVDVSNYDLAHFMEKGYTDRFIIALEDVSNINQLKLKFATAVLNDWAANYIKVYLITQKGNIIKESDLYGQTRWNRVVSPEPCGQTYITQIANPSLKNYANPTYDFEPCLNIPKLTEEGKVIVADQKVPEDLEELFDIYVVPTKPSMPLNTDLAVSVQYTGRYGSKVNQSSARIQKDIEPFGDAPASGMLPSGAMYLKNMKLSNVGTVTGVALSTVNADIPSISHVVVVRKRAGITVSTDIIPFNGTFLASPRKSAVSYDAPENVNTQKVKIKIDDSEFWTVDANGVETERAIELSRQNDILVKLKYKNELDTRETQLPYITRYFSLYDNGQSTIRRGDEIFLNLSGVNCVKEFTEINLAGTGVMNPLIESVTVNNYDFYGKQLPSFGANINKTLTETGESFALDGRDGMPVRLIFTTASSTGASTQAKIAATIRFTSENGDPKVKTIDDLSKYIIGQEYFTEGSTITAEIYLENGGLISELGLKTLSTDDWKIAKIRVERECKNGKIEVGESVSEKWVNTAESIFNVRPPVLRDEQTEEQAQKLAQSKKPAPLAPVLNPNQSLKLKTNEFRTVGDAGKIKISKFETDKFEDYEYLLGEETPESVWSVLSETISAPAGDVKINIRKKVVPDEQELGIKASATVKVSAPPPTPSPSPSPAPSPSPSPSPAPSPAP